MSLIAGTRLGPHEIVVPLGAGGMGEVYQAIDTRLNRTVAIKVLPAHLAQNPELRQRFEREARAVSSLNHPHICSLFDIGQQDGIDYLVMEYLEGETLAARLAKGPLAIDQALRYAVQMADALAQAHRQGVFHRDLKPGNVMLTKSGAKLLDFGLAKLRGAAAAFESSGGLSSLPTQAMDLTQKGTILGTCQYMAPEQLEGKDTDGRSDIFSFGALLYEAVTGRKAFEGKSQASVITAIMSAGPPAISVTLPAAPPALDRIVQRCLAKDPDERWQSAGDLASELKWVAEGGASQVSPAIPAVEPRRKAPSRSAWALAGVLLLLLLLSLPIVLVHLREAPARLPSGRFALNLPEKASVRWFDTAVVSPDGERVVFTAGTVDGKSLLWLRPLGSLAAQVLPGTDGAYFPFWSPDSRSVAFFANGKLKRLDLSGGQPQALADVIAAVGGAWNRDDVILFRSGPGAPLSRISASGGEAKPLTTLNRSQDETSHAWPWFLPDGRHFLYLAGSSRSENRAVYVASLDLKVNKRLPIPAESAAVYAAAPSGSGAGHLLFTRGESLMARPFDAAKLEVSGEASLVAEPVAPLGGTAGGSFSVSGNRVLTYRVGQAISNSELVWFDRDGKRLETVGQPADYTNPSLSPDGKKLAVGRRDPQTKTRDLWLFDLVRGTSSRLTFDPADDLNPVWSSDGRRIAFTSERKGPRNLYQKDATGVGADEVLLESDLRASTEDWSSDGRFLLFNVQGPRTPPYIAALPLFGDRKPVPVLQGPFRQDQAQLSPNGRWVAYRSDESGRDEIYVQAFTPVSKVTGKWQVSTAGGWEPQWRRDGKELYYLTDTRLMSVEVKADSSTFEAGIPKALFEVRLASAIFRNRYVTADGRRFLFTVSVEETGTSPYNVVVNWEAGSKR